LHEGDGRTANILSHHLSSPQLITSADKADNQNESGGGCEFSNSFAVPMTIGLRLLLKSREVFLSPQHYLNVILMDFVI
jgi:hypothetical protein